MPLDYLSELKESYAIAKSRSLTVTRATKITEWKSAFRSRNLCAILEISLDMEREELEETIMKIILC